MLQNICKKVLHLVTLLSSGLNIYNCLIVYIFLFKLLMISSGISSKSIDC